MQFCLLLSYIEDYVSHSQFGSKPAPDTDVLDYNDGGEVVDASNENRTTTMYSQIQMFPNAAQELM